MRTGNLVSCQRPKKSSPRIFNLSSLAQKFIIPLPLPHILIIAQTFIPQKFVAKNCSVYHPEIYPPDICHPELFSLLPRNLSPRIVQFITQKFIAQKFVAQNCTVIAQNCSVYRPEIHHLEICRLELFSLSPRNLSLRFNVSPRNCLSILKQIVFHTIMPN